jgi:hypothetical protein
MMALPPCYKCCQGTDVQLRTKRAFDKACLEKKGEGDMLPVFPYILRRSKDGRSGELLLRLRHGKTAIILGLSLEQARLLAVEMHGLATDHCTQHHLALSIAEVLGARITGTILKGVGKGLVAGAMRLETKTGLCNVKVDLAAALAMAFHLDLPIFLEGEHLTARDGLRAIEGPSNSPASGEIPSAFREVIEGLDIYPHGDE